MEHSEILHRCFRCGYCKLPASYTDLNCPAYLKYRFETFSPGGRMWLLRALLEGELQPGARFSQIMFSCAACGNCVEHCAFAAFKDEILDAFIAGRGELVERGAVPSAVKKYLEAVNLYGNPYKLPQAGRGDWAQGLGLQPYSDQEYLFYVGCVGSFDERGRRMARAVASVLQRYGVSFGILGAEECCDGNEVRVLGESMLFEQIARRNIEQFKAAGVAKIVTLSPHAYYAMRTRYPRYGGMFRVSHYSQLLAQVLAGRQHELASEPVKVAFHDPCYLGRHSKEYRAPRKVLEAVPGVTCLEMDRCEADALCCGGGGGNFFTDVLGGGPDSPARARVREAARSGADVVAVACPKCAKMLDDAVKVEDLDGRLVVRDLAEIVERAM